MDKISLLRTVFVFGGLEDALLGKIAAVLKETKYPAGKEIFRQGSTADAFYVIDSGEVSITKKLGPGREKILAVLGPGSVFGEMAFFSDSPRTADAVSNSETTLWKLERADFVKFIMEEPKAGIRVLSGLLEVSMDRLEQTSRELATIYQTGKIISVGSNLPSMAKGILEEVLMAVPEASGGALYLYNEFNDEFDPAAAPKGALEIPKGAKLIELLKKKAAGVYLGSREDAPEVREGFLAAAESAILSPILKGSELLGFIALWNEGKTAKIKKSRLLLVSTVSSQLAEAVENIRHRQEETDRQRLNNAKQSY
jgi:CRP-like cAMP-binding protein